MGAALPLQYSNGIQGPENLIVMNVLLLSPGYPADMPEFTRGLAEAGARVVGVGDTPQEGLPPLVRRCLSDYVAVRSLWDEQAVIGALRSRLRGFRLDRIECLWEPGILLAARLREAFGISGLDVGQAVRFRDKEAMKRALDAAGVRTPKHIAAGSVAEVWEASEAVGFPLILKPIDGAGSADTYRVADADELRSVLPRLRHVPAVSVEEFVDGEEFTFDTITVEGRIAYYNIAWYRPRPLVARSNEWISPQVIALRDLDRPELQGGVKMGFEVIEALGFDSGFTHMEWYRKADGEDVFGETRYNVANIYKRARGVGRITAIEGVDRLQRDFGRHVVWNTLLPVGARRRDWRKTLVSDGFIMLRHPDLDTTLEMADRVGSDLQVYAE